MRNSWRLCLLLCFVLFAFTACTTQNTVSEKEMVKKLRSTNQYVLCIMDADTGTIIQSKNSLQSNEKLDVSFLVKKVAERLQLDVSPVNFSNEKDKLIICLPGNASVVQNDSIKVKTAFFSSVANTIKTNDVDGEYGDEDYIEFSVDGKPYYVYEMATDQLISLKR